MNYIVKPENKYVVGFCIACKTNCDNKCSDQCLAKV
ncbi:MAG: hypothetical protein BWY74_03990 [Firmicutes bacterium ADurb.Bin419]|nr:MAG: hypothetical protein BWY74_03990 [Firmicutes bacterium ADurb.Bin419]